VIARDWVEAPSRIRVASAVRGLGEVSAGSSGTCSRMWEAGANATVPRRRSLGMYFRASPAANSAAWPPCEWPEIR
jgi:hypothetical protein